MKLYYVANARMPNEKAHGIQIAKMCEAFLASGADVTLVVSTRSSGDVRAFYALARDIPVKRLPVLDLQFLGPLGYRLTALQFAAIAILYLLGKVLRGERFAVYTIDMDGFSFAPLALVPRSLIAEMHSPKQSTLLTRFFMRRARIVATNPLIADALARAFALPHVRLFVEPNGVDASVLRGATPKGRARRRLNLPDEPFALYVGRIYAWKGLEILARAATESPLPIYVVGGMSEEYESVTGERAGRLRFFGSRPPAEIPLWLAAADVLLALGTARNAESYRYTAPMKLFEYLGARRPVVVSRTPANTSIVPSGAAFWYTPDDPHALAMAIGEAYESPTAPEKVAAGLGLARAHTWRARAERILAALQAPATLVP